MVTVTGVPGTASPFMLLLPNSLSQSSICRTSPPEKPTSSKLLPPRVGSPPGSVISTVLVYKRIGPLDSGRLALK
jgi:hypothetical protein